MNALAATFETAALRNRAVGATGMGQRLLLIFLFIAIASSSFVFIQPAPYEGLAALVLFGCVIGGVGLDRQIVPLLILTLVLDISGLVATIPVFDQPDALGFFGISIYLGLTGVMFACIFANDSLRRVAIVRAAWLLSAIPAIAIGLLAYFQLLPNAEIFLLAGRVSSTFKDPNVYGPFLVPPLLFLVQRLLLRGVGFLTIPATLFLLAGLFFSYSRGAWGNFALGLLVMLWLLFVTAPSNRLRIRIIILSLLAGLGVAMLAGMLISVDSIHDMFMQRANLVNDYDVGESGRFGVQQISIEMILEHPFGMGALEFARINVIPPHNIYLWITVSYGWIGGLAYIGTVLLTIVQGFRAATTRSPWQTPLIVAYAAYVGLAGEAFIIDTDHWRHYYVLLGLVWGLSAATKNYVRNTAVILSR